MARTLHPWLAAISCLLLAASAHAVDTQQIARGAYLARAADCTACHTATGGKPFGGGYPISLPFGTVYGSNISSDPEHGIGRWSDAQFLAAVREGKGSQGYLYPAMPYDSFAKMEPADVLAIKAYLMSLPPVPQAAPANQIGFPFNQRWGMWFWNLLNLDTTVQQNDPARSAEWNRGRYIVDALAHCAACHSPRTLTMAMDKSKYLGGGQIGAWTAYNITTDPTAGISNWSAAELQTYLRTGYAPGRASASGPMAEAVEHSFQYLSAPDIQAISTYLRSVPPQAGPDTRLRSIQGRPATDYAALRGSPPTAATLLPGAVLYLQNCATCHAASGAGTGQGVLAYPSLFQHSTVGAAGADNLVAVILGGVQRQMQAGQVFMPAFANDLDDAQVATLANYLRQQFGSTAAGTTAKDVAKLRAQVAPKSAKP